MILEAVSGVQKEREEERMNQSFWLPASMVYE